MPRLATDHAPEGFEETWQALLDLAGRPLIVVRVSDGRVWRSLLPGSYSWNVPLFPAADELWGSVTSGPAILKAETIVRYPYAKMELVQDHAP